MLASALIGVIEVYGEVSLLPQNGEQNRKGQYERTSQEIISGPPHVSNMSHLS